MDVIPDGKGVPKRCGNDTGMDEQRMEAMRQLESGLETDIGQHIRTRTHTHTHVHTSRS